ncbi:TraR/DksA family transcriptional regulator [Aquabacterium sp. A7-Y]|uniref:TraR/DksA family transcriptional regulator n=1 Tax=Aquabacterium sp. A7-Y TaxID=1349605 RepID=UPI00223DB984|nr:TraR/DksA family transcriptional regulator [Aquabacterium sp. A7-Y]MCW7539800.1 TraR/DksA family transcriptional regulator [Aquabacterium sp. A7-Y]
MTSLSDAQLSSLKAQLKEREQKLQGEVRLSRQAKEELAVGQAGVVGDHGDAAAAHLQAGIRHVETERDIEELLDIEAALERIQAGSYGECVDCGQDIAYARLQAQPSATRCADCQTVFERRHPTVLRDPG